MSVQSGLILPELRQRLFHPAAAARCGWIYNVMAYSVGKQEHVLHLCCTTNQHFTTTNSIYRDDATIQASRNATLSQANSINCHVVTWPQMSTSVVKSRFLPLSNEEDKLLHPWKMSKQATTHASTTECFLTFSCCRIQNVCATTKHFPGTSVIPCRLCVETG